MAYRLCVLLSYLLVCSTPCLMQTSIQPSGCSLRVMIVDQNTPTNCSRSNTSYICSQLQNALDIVASAVISNETDPVCITLTSGEHLLNYRDTQIDYNVHITGPEDGNTMVMCSPNAMFDEDVYEEFPIKFGGNGSVHIERVQFADCKRPLLFNNTANVTITNCSFSGFTQTALEIYSTESVTIMHSVFTDNISEGRGTMQSSGNAGAVSIGYHRTYPPNNTPLIHIMNCTFSDNSAKYIVSTTDESNCTSANSVLARKIYVKRGGGIACYFSADGLQSVVHIAGCMFQNNTAEDSGGGIYMNLNGRDSAVTNITITDTHFIDNKAIHGAGVEITFDTPDSTKRPNHLILERCHFKGNVGFQGGGMKLPQINQQGNLNSVKIIDCCFIENSANTGAALHIQTFLAGFLTEPVNNTRLIDIHSCTFSNNTGKRGVAFFSFNHVNFFGINQFLNNTGPALRLRGSLASFEGTVDFLDNRNHHEGLSGAVYVSSFSQLLLQPGVSINFTGNIGQEGAAIVVQTPRISSGFARTLYNPQCFLQFDNTTKPPIEWEAENVSLYFADNGAVIGPNLFITNLNACSWFNFSENYFDMNITRTWSFMDSSSPNYIKRNDTFVTLPERYVQTQLQSLLLGNSTAATQCSEGVEDVCAYPGQSITLNVEALDQFSNPTSAFLRLSQDKCSSSDQVDFIFTPSIVQTTADSGRITVQYAFNGPATYTPTTVNICAAFSSVNVSTLFMLRPLHCPPGFIVDEKKHVCVCEIRNRHVLACDPEMKFVLLNDGLWGAPSNWSRILVTYPCPPQYCNCSGSPNDNTTEGCGLIYNDPSKSCSPMRNGTLCGECVKPYGVGMLSMKCRKFTAKVNMYYWLIPMLVLFIVVAVIIIVKVGVTIPYFFLGFLLYIQISSLAVASFTQPFRLYTDVMTYINSFFSLYVPYDFSLHSRLTALEAYGLRYISPVLAMLVVAIVTPIKFHSRSWNGIWTLLLLMYGMTTETAASLLFCPTFTRTIANNTQHKITVWFFDGSRTCFIGAHLGLALVSLLALLLLSLLIPALIIIAYHKEFSSKLRVLDHRSLEKLSLSLTSPYHPHTRWWLPFELVRRFIFIMSVIYCPGYVTLPLLEAGLLLTLSWFIQPYKDWKANATEGFSMCMLVILLCLGNTPPLVDVGRNTNKVILAPLFYLPLVVGVVTSGVYAGWKLVKWKPIHKIQDAWMKLRSGEEGNRRYSRRFTEFESLRWRTSVKTTVVGFDNAEDQELSTM